MFTNVTEEKPAEIPEGTGDVKITNEEPEDTGDDGADDGADQEPAAARAPAPGGRPAKPAGPGRPGTRGERKNLWRENQQLRAEIAKIPSLIQQTQTELRREIAAITAAARQPAATPGAPAQSAEERELESIDQQMTQHLQLMQDPKYAGGKQWLELQTRKFQLIAAAEAAKSAAQLRQQQQGQRGEHGIEAARSARMEMLTSEFPWMLDREHGLRLSRMVGRRYQDLIDMGRPDSVDLHREAAAKVAAEMGLRARQAPPRVDPRAARARTGYGDGGERGGGETPSEVVVPRAQLEGTGLSEERIRRAVFGK